MKQHVLLLVGLLISTCLFAQDKDSTYFIRYGLNGILNRTNEASAYSLNNNLRFTVNTKDVVLNSNSNWLYGKQQKKLTNNDFYTALDVNRYFKQRKIYYWALTTYETSYSLKVNNRTQAGAGAAYNLVDKKDTFFINLSDGILYEFADLKINETSNDVYSTFRNSFRLRFRYKFNERVAVEGITFLQNSLSQKKDYIINSKTSVLIKLVKWISLTTSFNYNKVNRNNRENLLLTFGFTAEKYF